MAGKYKKCPRCELNYILIEEELCQVCKTELKLAPSEEEDDLELCTLCGKNLITVDQVMCDECARKRSIDDVVDELALELVVFVGYTEAFLELLDLAHVLDHDGNEEEQGTGQYGSDDAPEDDGAFLAADFAVLFTQEIL